MVLLVAMLSLGGLCSANADPGPAENVHLARPGAVSEPEILPASGVATDSRLDSAPAAPAPANGATVGPVAAAGADDTALLDELGALIEQEYVRPIPRDELRGAARRVLAGTLDPYSKVLDPAASTELDTFITGTFAGIGVRLDFDSASASYRVTGLFSDSPALRADLRLNDILLAIDGRPVAGRSMDEVVGALHGPSGSVVELTLRRAGAPADRRLSMKRKIIPSPTVRGLRRSSTGKWEYLTPDRSGVAYIRIEHFAENTPAELDRALTAIRRAGATALVLDLRVNPGGLVKAAIAVADRFLDAGTIFTFKHRNSLEVFSAHPGVGTRLPMAVLVDGYTQSVAELVSASLQDNNRAAVIGARSWGKGHGQQLFRLSGGRGVLKLSTFAFARPSGRPMERHFADLDPTLGGVWPDSGLAVELSPEEYDRWQSGLFALDDLMPLATGQRPAPSADRVLDSAVAMLRARVSQ